MAGVILEVLLVPRKAETLSMIRRAAETLDLNLSVCSDPAEAERLLFCHRYDGLILDHDESTDGILRALRQSPSSRSAIAIDIHNANVPLQTVFSLGANFEMVQPLTVDRARRTLQLAIGLMMLGRRRYYRHPVDFQAHVSAQGHMAPAWVTNVSEQGIGLRSDAIEMRAGQMHCTFDLPDNSGMVGMELTIVWADKAGQAGCRIEHITEGREEYLGWLGRLFHQQVASFDAPLTETPVRAISTPLTLS